MAKKKAENKEVKAKKPEKVNKPKKVDEMKQTHGMVEQYEPTTLDQVWGDDGLSKYKTMELGVYEEELKQMNKVDIKAHAIKVGLLPVDNTEQLNARLIREFKRHVSSFRRPTEGEHRLSTRQLPSDVLSILSEGK